MKTNRFQNNTLENAKENGGEARRLRVSRTPSGAKVTPIRCETPSRPARRVRQAHELERVTTVSAKIDVGFGNTLYIRGEGDGLSWNEGRPMVCIDGASWVWSSSRTNGSVTFKLLLNDQLWCRGENIHVEPGQTLEVVPSF